MGDMVCVCRGGTQRVVTAREDMEVRAEVILYILKLSPKSVSLILEQTLVA